MELDERHQFQFYAGNANLLGENINILEIKAFLDYAHRPVFWRIQRFGD
jgi:hypothetical protein